MPLTLTEKLKKIYRAQDTLPKLIEDGSIAEQKLDEYYVKLNILVEDKKAGNDKLPIELAQMFDPIAEQAAVGKILVTGVAGVGKSTFLNHITYEWSKDKVFSDTKTSSVKFDAILKVRLKSLLDEKLCRELENYPGDSTTGETTRLAIFIQRCIEQQLFEQKAEAKIDKVLLEGMADEIQALDRSKTLLLLDGYDEVEHLNRGAHMVREILNRIFEYPYIVITSRPNAVSSMLEAKFERKIENVGLGNDGARQYIEKYFKAQTKHLNEEIDSVVFTLEKQSDLLEQRELLQFYEEEKESKENPKKKDILATLETITQSWLEDTSHNKVRDFQKYISQYYDDLQEKLLNTIKGNIALREAIKTPINAAMMCLVSTDPEILAKLEGNFNAGAIYEGIIVWLGKRYLSKFKKEEIEDINFERILSLDELETLKKIAYDQFIIDKLAIAGDEIDKTARGIDKALGIRTVNKFGLLKAESAAVGFDLEVKLYSIPKDTQIKPAKLYLYVEEGQLSCKFIGRKIIEGKGAVETIKITKEEIKSINEARIGSIINSIKKQQRTFSNEEDNQALVDFMSTRGYALYIKDSNNHGLEITQEAKDLIHKSHSFIHLSFHEYLTAMSLKQLLVRDLQEGLLESTRTAYNKAAVEAAEFIAIHRNEPRYLMTLKFLAGLVTNEKGQNAQELVDRFWEAMTCNVDGVLELGAERKVTLLMHLLSQAETDKKLTVAEEKKQLVRMPNIDVRIPNIDKIIDFIDEVVLQDLLNWGKEIQASGYLSTRIKSGIKKMLKGDFSWAMEEATRIYASDKIDEEKTSNEIHEALPEQSLVVVMDVEKDEIVATVEEVTKDEQLILSKASKQEQEEIMTNTKRAIILASSLVAKLDKDSEKSSETLQVLAEYLEDGTMSWQVKKVVINAIEKIYQHIGDKIDPNKTMQIYKKLLTYLSDGNLNKDMSRAIKEILVVSTDKIMNDFLRFLLKNSNRDYENNYRDDVENNEENQKERKSEEKWSIKQKCIGSMINGNEKKIIEVLKSKSTNFIMQILNILYGYKSYTVITGAFQVKLLELLVPRLLKAQAEDVEQIDMWVWGDEVNSCGNKQNGLIDVDLFTNEQRVAMLELLVSFLKHKIGTNDEEGKTKIGEWIGYIVNIDEKIDKSKIVITKALELLDPLLDEEGSSTASYAIKVMDKIAARGECSIEEKIKIIERLLSLSNQGDNIKEDVEEENEKDVENIEEDEDVEKKSEEDVVAEGEEEEENEDGEDENEVEGIEIAQYASTIFKTIYTVATEEGVSIKKKVTIVERLKLLLSSIAVDNKNYNNVKIYAIEAIGKIVAGGEFSIEQKVETVEWLLSWHVDNEALNPKDEEWEDEEGEDKEEKIFDFAKYVNEAIATITSLEAADKLRQNTAKSDIAKATKTFKALKELLENSEKSFELKFFAEQAIVCIATINNIANIEIIKEALKLIMLKIESASSMSKEIDELALDEDQVSVLEDFKDKIDLIAQNDAVIGDGAIEVFEIIRPISSLNSEFYAYLIGNIALKNNADEKILIKALELIELISKEAPKAAVEAMGKIAAGKGLTIKKKIEIVEQLLLLNDEAENIKREEKTVEAQETLEDTEEQEEDEKVLEDVERQGENEEDKYITEYKAEAIATIVSGLKKTVAESDITIAIKTLQTLNELLEDSEKSPELKSFAAKAIISIATIDDIEIIKEALKLIIPKLKQTSEEQGQLDILNEFKDNIEPMTQNDALIGSGAIEVFKILEPLLSLDPEFYGSIISNIVLKNNAKEEILTKALTQIELIVTENPEAAIAAIGQIGIGLKQNVVEGDITVIIKALEKLNELLEKSEFESFAVQTIASLEAIDNIEIIKETLKLKVSELESTKLELSKLVDSDPIEEGLTEKERHALLEAEEEREEKYLECEIKIAELILFIKIITSKLRQSNAFTENEVIQICDILKTLEKIDLELYYSSGVIYNIQSISSSNDNIKKKILTSHDEIIELISILIYTKALKPKTAEIATEIMYKVATGGKLSIEEKIEVVEWFKLFLNGQAEYNANFRHIIKATIDAMEEITGREEFSIDKKVKIEELKIEEQLRLFFNNRGEQAESIIEDAVKAIGKILVDGELPSEQQTEIQEQIDLLFDKARNYYKESESIVKGMGKALGEIVTRQESSTEENEEFLVEQKIEIIDWLKSYLNDGDEDDKNYEYIVKSVIEAIAIIAAEGEFSIEQKIEIIEWLLSPSGEDEDTNIEKETTTKGENIKVKIFAKYANEAITTIISKEAVDKLKQNIAKSDTTKAMQTFEALKELLEDSEKSSELKSFAEQAIVNIATINNIANIEIIKEALKLIMLKIESASEKDQWDVLYDFKNKIDLITQNDVLVGNGAIEVFQILKPLLNLDTVFYASIIGNIAAKNIAEETVLTQALTLIEAIPTEYSEDYEAAVAAAIDKITAGDGLSVEKKIEAVDKLLLLFNNEDTKIEDIEEEYKDVAQGAAEAIDNIINSDVVSKLEQIAAEGDITVATKTLQTLNELLEDSKKSPALKLFAIKAMASMASIGNIEIIKEALKLIIPKLKQVLEEQDPLNLLNEFKEGIDLITKNDVLVGNGAIEVFIILKPLLNLNPELYASIIGNIALKNNAEEKVLIKALELVKLILKETPNAAIKAIGKIAVGKGLTIEKKIEIIEQLLLLKNKDKKTEGQEEDKAEEGIAQYIVEAIDKITLGLKQIAAEGDITVATKTLQTLNELLEDAKKSPELKLFAIKAMTSIATIDDIEIIKQALKLIMPKLKQASEEQDQLNILNEFRNGIYPMTQNDALIGNAAIEVFKILEPLLKLDDKLYASIIGGIASKNVAEEKILIKALAQIKLIATKAPDTAIDAIAQIAIGEGLSIQKKVKIEEQLSLLLSQENKNIAKYATKAIEKITIQNNIDKILQKLYIISDAVGKPDWEEPYEAKDSLDEQLQLLKSNENKDIAKYANEAIEKIKIAIDGYPYDAITYKVALHQDIDGILYELNSDVKNSQQMEILDELKRIVIESGVEMAIKILNNLSSTPRYYEYGWHQILEVAPYILNTILSIATIDNINIIKTALKLIFKNEDQYKELLSQNSYHVFRSIIKKLMEQITQNDVLVGNEAIEVFEIVKPLSNNNPALYAFIIGNIASKNNDEEEVLTEALRLLAQIDLSSRNSEEITKQIAEIIAKIADNSDITIKMKALETSKKILEVLAAQPMRYSRDMNGRSSPDDYNDNKFDDIARAIGNIGAKGDDVVAIKALELLKEGVWSEKPMVFDSCRILSEEIAKRPTAIEDGEANALQSLTGVSELTFTDQFTRLSESLKTNNFYKARNTVTSIGKLGATSESVEIKIQLLDLLESQFKPTTSKKANIFSILGNDAYVIPQAIGMIGINSDTIVATKTLALLIRFLDGTYRIPNGLIYGDSTDVPVSQQTGGYFVTHEVHRIMASGVNIKESVAIELLKILLQGKDRPQKEYDAAQKKLEAACKIRKEDEIVERPKILNEWDKHSEEYASALEAFNFLFLKGGNEVEIETLEILKAYGASKELNYRIRGFISHLGKNEAPEHLAESLYGLQRSATIITGPIAIRTLKLLATLSIIEIQENSYYHQSPQKDIEEAAYRIIDRGAITTEIFADTLKFLIPLVSNEKTKSYAIKVINKVIAISASKITMEIATEVVAILEAEVVKNPGLSNLLVLIIVNIGIKSEASIATAMLKLLAEKLPSSDDQIIIEILDDIVEEDSNEKLAISALKRLIPLINEAGVEDVVQEIVSKMSVPSLAKELTPNGAATKEIKIEDIFITELNKRLHDLLKQESMQKLAVTEQDSAAIIAKNVKITLTSMLMIIGQEAGEPEGAKKELQESAIKILNKQVAMVNQCNLIGWINTKFDALVQLSTRTKKVMTDIYRLVLSDETISKDDSEFIIKCIKLGLTTTIIKPTKFKIEGQDDYFTIVFGKHSYQLKGANNLKYLEKIIQAALSNQNDRLAKQYSTHEPLFPNREAGMRKAAIDISTEEVVSIVDKKSDRNALDSLDWSFSLMSLSDHKKSNPSQQFILLERRNGFGYYEVYRLKINPANEIIIDSDSVFVTHPRDVNTAFRRTIFGEMWYHEKGPKPRYYSNSETMLLLNLDKKANLKASITKTIDTLISTGKDSKTTTRVPFTIPEWKKDTGYTDAQEHKKIDLLDLESNGDESFKTEVRLTRMDSFRIESFEFQAEMKQLQKKLENIDFDSLNNILNKEKYTHQQQEILEGLDDYHSSFHDTLIIQLNAMYVATSSIQSQLIDSNNSNQGITGKLGGFLQSISAHVPLVGFGVQMIGAVMTQVDQNDQADSMGRYAAIVSTSGEMEKLAGEIAIHLVQNTEILKIPDDTSFSVMNNALDQLSQAVSYSETAVQVVAAVRTTKLTNVLQSFDFVTVTANAISGIKSRINDVNAATAQDGTTAKDGSATSSKVSVAKYAELLICGVKPSEQDKQQADGAALANDVAAFIIKKIFAGEITAGDGKVINKKIPTIVGAISQKLSIPYVIDEVKGNFFGLKPTTQISPEMSKEEKIALSILERCKALIDAKELDVVVTKKQVFITALSSALKQNDDSLASYTQDVIDGIAKQLQLRNIISVTTTLIGGRVIKLNKKFAVVVNNIIIAAKQEQEKIANQKVASGTDTKIVEQKDLYDTIDKKIAYQVLQTCKVLIDENEIAIDSYSKIELLFIEYLASTLQRHGNLLEKITSDNTAKDDLVEHLIMHIHQSKILSMQNDRLIVNNRFAIEQEFFTKIVEQVNFSEGTESKLSLKQKTKITKSQKALISAASVVPITEVVSATASNEPQALDESIYSKIAEDTLQTYRILIDTNQIVSDDPYSSMEVKFKEYLIHELQQYQAPLKITASDNIVLVENLVRQIHRSKILSIKDGKFILSNKFAIDSKFLAKAIIDPIKRQFELTPPEFEKQQLIDSSASIMALTTTNRAIDGQKDGAIDVADKALKTTVNANQITSDKSGSYSKIELVFIEYLARAIKKQDILSEISDNAEKNDLIKRLVIQIYGSNTLSIKDNKFILNDQFIIDQKFFTKIINQVKLQFKDTLKSNTKQASSSAVAAESTTNTANIAISDPSLELDKSIYSEIARQVLQTCKILIDTNGVIVDKKLAKVIDQTPQVQEISASSTNQEISSSVVAVEPITKAIDNELTLGQPMKSDETIDKDIAYQVLQTCKILIDVNEAAIDNYSKIEQLFMEYLARTLRRHDILLKKVIDDNIAKDKLAEKLIIYVHQAKMLSIQDNKLILNNQFAIDQAFFTGIVAQVELSEGIKIKPSLKQNLKPTKHQKTSVSVASVIPITEAVGATASNEPQVLDESIYSQIAEDTLQTYRILIDTNQIVNDDPYSNMEVKFKEYLIHELQQYQAPLKITASDNIDLVENLVRQIHRSKILSINKDNKFILSNKFALDFNFFVKAIIDPIKQRFELAPQEFENQKLIGFSASMMDVITANKAIELDKTSNQAIDIAGQALKACKILINTNQIISDSYSKKELVFIEYLAKTIRQYQQDQTLLIDNNVAKNDLMECLTIQIHRSQVLSIKDNNFILNEQFIINQQFFIKMINQAKLQFQETLKLSITQTASSSTALLASTTKATGEITSNAVPELDEAIYSKIAENALKTCRILIDADHSLDDSLSEKEMLFIEYLARALRKYKNLPIIMQNNDAKKDKLANDLGVQLYKSKILSIQNDQFIVNNKFVLERKYLINIMKQTELPSDMDQKGTIAKPGSSNACIISYCTGIKYDSDNLLLYQDELIYEAGQIGGIEAINNLINLGEDVATAKIIIDAAKEYGVRHLMNIIFAPQITQNIKLQKMDYFAINRKDISNAESDDQISTMLLAPERNTEDSVELRDFDALIAIKNHPNTDNELQLLMINSETTFLQTFQILGIFKEAIKMVSAKLDIDLNWLYKSMIYRQEIIRFNEILQNNGIDKSIDVLRDYSDFRKSVLLKLHPDKGGDAQNFVFVNELQKKFAADLDINQLLVDQLQNIQNVIHKTSVGFKTLDTIVDTTRLVYEPTIEHIKKLAFDTAHLYSMYYGVNSYSLGLTTADVLYKTYQGEYEQALKQIITSASYMALPTMIGCLGVSYLGVVYAAGMTAYTGYGAITNLYSFCQSYHAVEFQLKSLIAYRDLIKVLVNSPLQQVYDFTAEMHKYMININNINLNLEKTTIKTKLVEEKGEFGQKLYDYIHEPVLKEKYELLNKVMKGSITEEQAEMLKAKHIKINLEAQAYQYCIEIKNIKDAKSSNDSDIEHYYCYNEEQQILDHIVIGESRGDFEVVERL